MVRSHRRRIVARLPSSHSFVAFKLKMRAEVLPNATTTDEKQFEARINLTREIADVLRKNIVQARRIEGSEDKWRMFEAMLTQAGYLRISPVNRRASHNRVHRARRQ